MEISVIDAALKDFLRTSRHGQYLASKPHDSSAKNFTDLLTEGDTTVAKVTNDLEDKAAADYLLELLFASTLSQSGYVIQLNTRLGNGTSGFLAKKKQASRSLIAPVDNIDSSAHA